MTNPTPSKARCRRCGYRVTWAEQRKQYARMMQRGLPPHEAKALLPRCQTCTTAAFHGHLDLHR